MLVGRQEAHRYLSFREMMRTCNETEVASMAQMDLHLYHIINLTTVCLTCVGNMLLSVPLLVAIIRSPSLLCKLRYLVLFHLLCCDNMQLLVLLAQAVLLTRFTMPVTQCVVFMATTEFLVMVALFLRAALSVDCCMAIKMPLRYETLLSPRRQRVAMALVWAASLLLSTVAMCMVLDRVRVNPALPICTPYVVAPCLSDLRPVTIFSMVISGLVLPLCSLTVLGCFGLLCFVTQGQLCLQRRAGVTLTLQAVQMVIHSVSLVMHSTLISSRVQSERLDLAIQTVYILGISLISLVYGYRSRELQNRLLKRPVCNQVSTSK